MAVVILQIDVSLFVATERQWIQKYKIPYDCIALPAIGDLILQIFSNV